MSGSTINGGGLWHTEKDPDERAKKLFALVSQLSNDNEARRRRILRNLRLYEGRELSDLTASAYYQNFTGGAWDNYRVQLSRALVSTATAKIAGKQRPKAMFCVTNGDWSVKRKAKKKERFVEAVMQQRQDGGHDAYEVLLESFKDCAYADCGATKFWPDFEGKRIVIERVLPWELVFDPRETRSGTPLNWFHDYGYDRFKLAARFPKFEREIMAAPSINETSPGRDEGNAKAARQVRVVEGWRVALSKDKPGVHCISVGGVDLTGGEEWRWTFAPFELQVWEKWRIGCLGTSLVEITAAICEEVNQAYDRWSQAERLGSQMIGQAEENSVRPEDIESNKQMTWILRNAGTPPVTIQAPETQGAASMAWFRQGIELAFNMSGVSQADSAAQREEGLASGEAQRTVATIKSERFAVQWQSYERVGAIGATRQILRCADEIYDVVGDDFTVSYADGAYLQELKYADLNVELPDEAIQVYAVSGLVNTPADRLDLAEKLFNMGILSQDGFLRVIQAKDIDRELERMNTQEALLEKYMEQWRDYEGKDDIESGKFKYRGPKKWLNLEEAIVQVGRAYMQAEIDEAPDQNLEWFIKFLGDCDTLLQRLAEKQAQLKAAAGGAPSALAALPGGPAPGGALPPQGGPSAPPPGGPPMPQQGAMAA